MEWGKGIKVKIMTSKCAISENIGWDTKIKYLSLNLLWIETTISRAADCLRMDQFLQAEESVVDNRSSTMKNFSNILVADGLVFSIQYTV